SGTWPRARPSCCCRTSPACAGTWTRPRTCATPPAWAWAPGRRRSPPSFSAPPAETLSGPGRDGQDPAQQVDPAQGPDPLIVERSQRRVIARIEGDRLVPHHPLGGQPGRAVADLDAGETRLLQAAGQVDPAGPGTAPFPRAVHRLP